MSLLLGGWAYASVKNTLARLCAKNAGGEYLLDTTVYVYTPVLHLGLYCMKKQSLAALRGNVCLFNGNC